MVIKNSERYAEHITVCELNAARASPSVVKCKRVERLTVSLSEHSKTATLPLKNSVKSRVVISHRPALSVEYLQQSCV